jgi:hypothetical protein
MHTIGRSVGWFAAAYCACSMSGAPIAVAGSVDEGQIGTADPSWSRPWHPTAGGPWCARPQRSPGGRSVLVGRHGEIVGAELRPYLVVKDGRVLGLTSSWRRTRQGSSWPSFNRRPDHHRYENLKDDEVTRCGHAQCRSAIRQPPRGELRSGRQARPLLTHEGERQSGGPAFARVTGAKMKSIPDRERCGELFSTPMEGG